MPAAADPCDPTLDEALQPSPDLRRQAQEPQGAWVTVAATSMAPTLVPGARVQIRAGHARPGDVIVFVSAAGDRAVVHRVVASLPGTPFLFHAGDANRHTGRVAVVRRSQVIGIASDLPRRVPTAAQCRGVLRLLGRRLARALAR